MSYDEEFQKIFSGAIKFLKQQQELYGGFLILDNNTQKSENSSTGPIMNKSPRTTETDLFGNPISAVKSQDKIGLANTTNYPNEPWTKVQSLVELENQINTCKKCSLGNTRNKFVFGVGNPKAEVVVIGEAPGADEDEQGEPFVGRGGQLLTKILEAIHFKRDEVYICNILKCRPPNNRDPQSKEIDCCEPYLWKQLELINPKLILCAGRIAGQALLKTNASLAALRGKTHDYHGIPLMVTYHPAALLRNPGWKRPCWEDVQRFRKMYDDMKSSR